MAKPGTIELKWADGEHAFRLTVGAVRELQEKTGAGPEELLRRIIAGRWRIDDLRETLRIALIGGGAKPVEATSLIQRYVDERPFREAVLPAQAILAWAIYGEAMQEEKQPGEPEGRKGENGQTDGSLSPISTARVQ